jgi:hypothetical protein
MNMKTVIRAVLVVCLAVVAVAQEKNASNPPSLTIYNQNFGLVRERISMDLSPGVNHISFTGVTAHLEPQSLVLRDPSSQRSLQVLEQNYRNDPVTQEALLSLYEGQSIQFLRPDGSSVKGRIVRSGYVAPMIQYGQYTQPSYQQPLIEVDGTLRFGLPGQPIFPSLTGDTILKPTVTWDVQTDKPGRFEAELSYVTSGMSWQADYNLIAPERGDVLDLVGWVTIDNHTSHVFENAHIKLLAGDVNKIQANDYRTFQVAAMKARADEASNAPAVTEKSFDEYHMYTLGRPTTLHDQETKQVEFVRGTGIAGQRLYVYDGAAVDWNQYQYWSAENIRSNRDFGTQCNKKVWVMQQFANSAKNGLGIPMPKGKLRFYRKDSDGNLEFTGESLIDHTPKDETIRVYTGNSFDLTGERKRTNYQIDTTKDWLDESFEIRLRNHKKEPVTFTVAERLYRGLNWRITQESHPHKKTEAQKMEFQITVAPGSEQVLTYTVHYNW